MEKNIFLRLFFFSFSSRPSMGAEHRQHQNKWRFLTPALLQWSDTKWFITTAINLFGTSLLSSLAASYDLIPDFMNRKTSYDLMIVHWHSSANISYHTQPLVQIQQLLYTSNRFYCFFRKIENYDSTRVQ